MPTNKFTVGMKVLIGQPREHWNIDGKMNHWVNKVMTIREILRFSETTTRYKMVEDQAERGRKGWNWLEIDFVAWGDCSAIKNAIKLQEEGGED